jgi:hypothetical protein
MMKSPLTKCGFIGVRLSNFSDSKKDYHKNEKDSGLSPEIMQNKTQVASD